MEVESLSSPTPSSSSTAPAPGAAPGNENKENSNKNNQQSSNQSIQTLQQLNEITFQRIATFHSPFKSCFGCPRQGIAAPSTRGRITLEKWFNNPQYFQNLEQFSHIWVVFVFDRNNVQSAQQSKQLKPTVRPPRLGNNANGSKSVASGIFATRTPHRPNPMGFTVMKLDKVDGKSLLVSGVDIVDGTFILDIKPFHLLDAGPIIEGDDAVFETSKQQLQWGKVQQSEANGAVEKENEQQGDTDHSQKRRKIELTQQDEVYVDSVSINTSEERWDTDSLTNQSQTPPQNKSQRQSEQKKKSHYPKWVIQSQRQHQIEWTLEALDQLKQHKNRPKFYPDRRDTDNNKSNSESNKVSNSQSNSNIETESSALQKLKSAIEEVISMDIRTSQHKRKEKDKDKDSTQKQSNTTNNTTNGTGREVWAFYYDNLNILFREKETDPINENSQQELNDQKQNCGFEIVKVEAMRKDGNNTCWSSWQSSQNQGSDESKDNKTDKSQGQTA